VIRPGAVVAACKLLQAIRPQAVAVVRQVIHPQAAVAGDHKLLKSSDRIFV
jgi:hypothetical protein